MPPAASDAPPPLDAARLARRVLFSVAVGTFLIFTLTRLHALFAAPEVSMFHPIEWSGEWIAAAAVAWTGALPFQALRWRALLPRPHPPRAGLAWLVTGANLLNIALPGPTGELAAAWVAHRRWGVPLAAAVYTSLLARVVALVTLGALALVGWPLLLAGGSAAAGWLAVGALAFGLGGAGLVVAIVAPAPTARLAIRAAGILPERLRGPLASRATWWADNARDLAPRGVAPWLAAGGWSAAAALVQGGATALAFHAVGTNPPALPLLYTHVLASLASVAALVLPGGLGAMESVYVAVLPALRGADAVSAFFGVLAVRQAQLGSMLCSLPALLWLVRAAARAPTGPR